MEQGTSSAVAPEYLNEESMALLESHWSELSEQAHVESTREGWKLVLHGPAKLFAKAGFHKEESISPSRLLHFAKSTFQRGLVERLLAILEHLKK